jgi:tetratricopeptide (TPR) repeat protein
MSSRRTIDPDAIMQRIGDAVAFDYAGNREGARARLAALWDEIHPDGDALHRCMIAHYMADMQADPRQELLWDRRALGAAGSLTGTGAKEYHPSLHLNLAENYRKLGDWDAAREHLAQATEFARALTENGYGNVIRRGIASLAALPEFIGC